MASKTPIKILFFGDIVGKIGRKALAQILPRLKKEFKPDLILANGENLAHGSGFTKKTVEEVLALGVDLLTSGNHFSKKEFKELVTDNDYKILRPANYPPSVPGVGYKILKVKGKKVIIINLIGRVFFRENFDCPFRKFDELKNSLKLNKNDIIIVDFHSEATSEKVSLGWYLDGQVSAVLGTHTHVPTCDLRILTEKTAYVSDLGMVGARDGVIGVAKEGPLQGFLQQLPGQFTIPEKGWAVINAVFLAINPKNGKAEKISRVDRMLEIK